MNLPPESLFRVTADANGIRVVNPAGRERSVSWSFLERLVILTNDQGPFLPDVFWGIEPIEEPAFAFPGGAAGEDEFLPAVQAQLAGFRNDRLIEAMTSTSNQVFVVWERDPWCPRCEQRLPEFPELTHAQRLDVRRIIDSSGPMQGIQRLRELTGCDLRQAKLWIHHRGVAGSGHAPLAPCPHCGEPLRTAEARQCRFCKRDWHDPARITRLGGEPLQPPSGKMLPTDR